MYDIRIDKIDKRKKEKTQMSFLRMKFGIVCAHYTTHGEESKNQFFLFQQKTFLIFFSKRKMFAVPTL